MNDDRYERQERLFGRDGQGRIARHKVVLVGAGGLGSHLAQQLAYLGVRSFAVIDADRVSSTNLNRLVGAYPSDLEPEEMPLKVDLLARLIGLIAPEAVVEPIPKSFISEEGYSAIREADYVFGGVDGDGVRLLLSQVCAAYAKPYFDLATEINPEANPLEYGGRVFFLRDGAGCLKCAGELDDEEVRRDLMTPEQRVAHDRIYGLKRSALGDSGPSVVSLNGAVVSLAVTEFMVEVTGLRRAERLLRYRAHQQGKVTRGEVTSDPDCTLCATWGSREQAGTERYIQQGFGQIV